MVIVSKRIATFDIMKGIGIILVIVGHTFAKEIGMYIVSFHMPLFFVISGYFYKPINLMLQIKKDFRRLIVPYLFICFSIMAIAMIKKYHSQHVVDFFVSTLYECETPAWFLLALYGAKLVFAVVLKYCPSRYLSVSFLFASISCMLTMHFNLPPVLSIGSSFCGVFFVALGFYVKQKKLLAMPNRYGVAFIVLSLFLWLNTSIFGQVDIHYSIFKLWILDFMGACGGIYLCFRISKFIDSLPPLIAVRRLFERGGYYSFVVFSFHAVEYTFPDWHRIADFFVCGDLRAWFILLFRFLIAYLAVQLTLKLKLLKNIFFY